MTETASVPTPDVTSGSPEAVSGPEVRAAGAAPPRRGLRLSVVALLVALDQVTKYAMFRWLERTPGAPVPEGAEIWFNQHWRVPVIGDFLGLMLSENKGAAWGMGDQFPYLLVIGRAVAVCVLLWLLWRAPRRPAIAVWAYGLVLAGALGNLIDNLFREPPPGHPFGAVRDFIHVYFESFEYHFPTFNVADSCITVGAVLLILSGMLAPSEAPERPAAEEAA